MKLNILFDPDTHLVCMPEVHQHMQSDSFISKGRGLSIDKIIDIIGNGLSRLSWKGFTEKSQS